MKNNVGVGRLVLKFLNIFLNCGIMKIMMIVVMRKVIVIMVMG